MFTEYLVGQQEVYGSDQVYDAGLQLHVPSYSYHSNKPCVIDGGSHIHA